MTSCATAISPRDPPFTKTPGVEDDEDLSVNSQDEALCEILGIHSLETLAVAMEDETESKSATTKPQDKTLHPEGFHNPTISCHKIVLPRNVSRHFHPPSRCFAWEIRNVLTQEECQQLIQQGESHSMKYITQATHTSPDGKKYQVPLQNPNPHKLAVFGHEASCQRIWKKIEPLFCSDDHSALSKSFRSFLKRESLDWPTRLNPRLPVLRYDATDQDEFAPHFDATTSIHDHERDPDAQHGEISLLTVLVYLNSGNLPNDEQADFAGGETMFLNASQPLKHPTSVTPQAGSIVLFEHDLFHSGRPLDWGTKYVLRTDILFGMSQTQWDQRPHLAAGTSPKPQDDEKDEQTGTLSPLTIRELATRMGWNVSELQGLEDLGLADSTMEAFCAPGRVALQTMLQDIMMHGRNHNSQESLTKIQSLIQSAFDLWRDSN